MAPHVVVLDRAAAAGTRHESALVFSMPLPVFVSEYLLTLIAVELFLIQTVAD